MMRCLTNLQKVALRNATRSLGRVSGGTETPFPNSQPIQRSAIDASIVSHAQCGRNLVTDSDRGLSGLDTDSCTAGSRFYPTLNTPCRVKAKSMLLAIRERPIRPETIS